ncbi:MAG: glycosyltransferase [Chloracidobacterium sp.]|nr:glycosyltransferase [Chloracidobacterium sp.]MDW8216678.1 glycosyltransferase family 2 protein [Acidobacteriota bacterium]
MSKRAGVSILVPNWNHRYCLPRAIRSAFAGMRRLQARGVACELLIVDDASRDGSQKYLFHLAAQYPDLATRVVWLEKNGGLGAARNVGLTQAAYRHACLLDADNELEPENLWLFYRAALETDAALTYGNLIVLGDGQPDLLSNETLHARVYRQNYVDSFALLDAHAALAAGGYVTTRGLLEDWELLMRLLARNARVVFVPAVFGYYHRSPGSLHTVAPEALAHRLRRIFDQDELRSREGRLIGRMYHPAVGWLA